MGIFEGIFTATIIFCFFFWMYAKFKGVSALEMFNDTMDSIFGEKEYEDISKSTSKFKNPFKKLKELGVKDINLHKPTEDKGNRKYHWK